MMEATSTYETSNTIHRATTQKTAIFTIVYLVILVFVLTWRKYTVFVPISDLQNCAAVIQYKAPN
jgi:hypothetical protein